MKLSSSASVPTISNTAEILSFLRLLKQLIVNTLVICSRCTYDCLMHTQQIQYDYLIHMQPMPFSLSTHLMHIRQTPLCPPDSYAADASFSIYAPHAYAADANLRPQSYAADMHLQTSFMLYRYVISLSTPSCTSSRHGLTSSKTPVNDLDNPILLLFRHLVIAR